MFFGITIDFPFTITFFLKLTRFHLDEKVSYKSFVISWWSYVVFNDSTCKCSIFRI